MGYRHCINSIIFVLLLIGCSASSPLLQPDMEYLSSPAPSEFTVLFTTSKGEIHIEVKREYSPLAVDRFYYLVENNYYNSNRFFRVVPNFVVQWGMKGIPKIDKVWSEMGVKDEPVKSKLPIEITTVLTPVQVRLIDEIAKQFGISRDSIISWLINSEFSRINKYKKTLDYIDNLPENFEE